MQIRDSILDCIGQTPLVRVNNIFPQAKCEVLAKCEFLNPGGSHKDRIATYLSQKFSKIPKSLPQLRMLTCASSGNTGIALGMLSAVKQNKMIAVLPEKNSHKMKALEILGVEVVIAPNVEENDPQSYIKIAKKFQEDYGIYNFDQYNTEEVSNLAQKSLAEEIYQQTNGKVDYVVMCGSTGGSLTALSKAFKQLDPSIKVIGVDHINSMMSGQSELPKRAPLLEGVGRKKILPHADFSNVSEWFRVADFQSFIASKELCQKEGLLVGGSSGAVLIGVKKLIKKYDLIQQDVRIVMICPDSAKNYSQRFVDNDWMIQNKMVSLRSTTMYSINPYSKPQRVFQINGYDCFSLNYTHIDEVSKLTAWAFVHQNALSQCIKDHFGAENVSEEEHAQYFAKVYAYILENGGETIGTFDKDNQLLGVVSIISHRALSKMKIPCPQTYLPRRMLKESVKDQTSKIPDIENHAFIFMTACRESLYGTHFQEKSGLMACCRAQALGFAGQYFELTSGYSTKSVFNGKSLKVYASKPFSEYEFEGKKIFANIGLKNSYYLNEVPTYYLAGQSFDDDEWQTYLINGKL